MNSAKAKGDRFELRVLEKFHAAGFTHWRRTKAGATHDVGDLSGDSWVAYEVRNRKAMDLAANLRAAKRHAEAANKPLAVTIMKRPGVADAGESYAVMSLDDFIQLRKLVEEL